MWGYSHPLDLQTEVTQREDRISDNLEVLIVGAGDARHIMKTLASSYTHPDRSITYHVIEPTLEQVARSILLLSICLERNLGLQEATRYYLEILGNTLLRPATAKYLAKCTKQLIDIPTRTVNCPWLSLEKFKHKDRDNLECIFKFWRNNGVAFTWLEGEPARSNSTLINNIIQHGSGFVHYAYLGDIVNGPYFTWAVTEKKEDKKLRATDIAEREIMRAIYEIRTREPLCEDYVGAHRDTSILNGVIVNEMPDIEIENESWTSIGDKSDKEKISWVEVPNHKIIFHPATSLESYKSKCEYVNRFNLVWIAHNMTKQLENLVPLASTGAPVIVESRKYIADLRKEDLKNFTEELKELAQKNGLRSLHDFDSNEHVLARFCKN
ncbi:dynein assembly factor axonemal-like protein [Lasius niger]|uniref:Dynein assembly factor axonemal-like protein n=1 Tax=Lasius niger TaxID=67767 RepID=A0A0J7L0Y9_LASNI|nr:dynein assembly factor axonemal-like protein [Lasius niger]